MRAEGHVGFSLILSCPLMLYLTRGGIFNIQTSIVALMVIASVSTVPDLDIRLEIKHRYYTHNITFTTILSAVIAYIASKAGISFIQAFIVCFLGIVSHLLIDLFNYVGLPLAYPLSKKRYSLKIVTARNRAANKALFTMGVTSLVLYLLYVMLPPEILFFRGAIPSLIMLILPLSILVVMFIGVLEKGGK